MEGNASARRAAANRLPAAGRVSHVRLGTQAAFFLFTAAVTGSDAVERVGVDLPWNALRNVHAVCPFGAVEAAGTLLLTGGFVPKTGTSNLWVLAGVALSTLVLGAVFCGWLCPLGSLLGLLQAASLYTVRVHADSCSSCDACVRSCPMGCRISGAVRDPRCNRCLACLSSCRRAAIGFAPPPGVPFLRKLSLTRGLAVASVTAVLMDAPVLAAVSGGWLDTGSSGVLCGGASRVEGTGARSPDDVRGAMTLQELARFMGMDRESLYALLSLPGDTRLYLLEELGGGLTLQQVKELIAEGPQP